MFFPNNAALLFSFKLILGGVAIGISNLIPGLSGATVALLLGIYPRIMRVLGRLDFSLGSDLIKGRWGTLASKLDLSFFGPLCLGIGLGVFLFSGAFLLLLVRFQVFTLSFLFGLVLASIGEIWGKVQGRSPRLYGWLLVSVGLGSSVLLLPAHGSSESFFTMLLHGSVAMAGMLVPGISGSHLLLLMGGYDAILRAIETLDLARLFPFTLGCVFSLLFLGRLLSHILDRFYKVTMTSLTGIVLGTLPILWPWRRSELLGSSFFSQTYLPDFSWTLLYCVAWMVAGFLTVFTFHWLQRRQHPTERHSTAVKS